VGQFDEAAQFVRPEDLDPFVHISSDLDRHAEWIRGFQEMGFNRITLHNVNREQEPFIHAFGETVLPQLRGASAAY
jgi:hypothetical protein